MQTRTSSGEASRIAEGLGYAGLIPFVVAVALLWYPPLEALAAAALLAYAALILSFVGAVHWGVALNGDRAGALGAYVRSVLPALLAWFLVLLPQPYAFPGLAVAFLGWWRWERVLPAATFPGWYLRLRTHLTLVVVVALTVGWWRVAGAG